MKLTNASEVSVYTISGASTARPLPDWLARRRKRSLKNDPEFANRVELLQDFEFEEASTAIRISEDGNWVMSTGTYKPQIHVHNLPQLSLSFARHTSSLNTTFQLLSQDYSKSLHLQTDRKLEFHTPMGCHYEMRLPRYGRDLAYDRHSTEALVPAVGLDAEGNGEVFRLNLELGRFMKSYYIDIGQDDDPEAGRQGSIKVGAVNVAAIAESTHNLLAFGTSKGSVEFWDPRSKSRVAALTGLEGEVTALEFAPSGISIATGHSTGLIQIFDLRRPAPILTKDQEYGNPIKNIIHMTTPSQEPKILSADKKVIKIWDENTGNAWTSIEAIVDLNDVAWCPNTGMILTANEGKHQHAFFVPQLGPAPKWCSFLDNMVEEMAEEHNTETYDNYKFLTVAELHEFSLDHLIGKTNLLRPYMHGFFVDNKLYEQARLIHNPYLYEEDRARKVQERAEKKREGRIRGSSKKLKVPQNQNLIDRLAEKDSERGAGQKKRQDAEGLLSDSRFGVAFKDSKFVFDENSEEFLAQNNAVAATAAKHAALKPKRKEVEMRELPNPAESESEDLVESESDEEILYGRKKDRSDDEEVEMHISSSKSRGAREKRDSSFATKAKQSGRTGKTKKSEVLGEQEMRFVPEPRTKSNEGASDTKSGVKKRRFEDRRSASGNALRRQ